MHNKLFQFFDRLFHRRPQSIPVQRSCEQPMPDWQAIALGPQARRMRRTGPAARRS